MAGICHVCSQEPAKYKCPTCTTGYCSVDCSKAHKPNCVPSAVPAETSDVNEAATPSSHNGGTNTSGENGRGWLSNLTASATGPPSISALESSTELQELLARKPGLRAQLQDIYRSTLEEEWIEQKAPSWGGRGGSRGRGRGGRGGGVGSRGPWTAQKGFNRGMGKVRRWRESCEDGDSGVDAEAYARFAALVDPHVELEQDQADMERDPQGW